MRKILPILCLLTLLLISVPTLATPGVEWSYFETQHFRVIYHPEVQEQANQVATIAEDVYKTQTKFTGFTPYRKIAIIVSGLDDFANGLAIPRDLMKIWVNPLFTATRVEQDWLKNLVTHELTHILQMEATFGLTYWTQKLTGAATTLGVPPNVFYPTWYLEGVAQYGSTRQGSDQLDRKRQMILEQHINNDKFFTGAELYWMRSNIGGEAYYNFGYGFFEFLMRRYGEKKFLQLQKTHNSLYFLGLSNTIRIVYHKKLPELLAEWKGELRAKYPVRNQAPAETLADKPALSEWKEPAVTSDGSVIFLQIDYNRPEQQIKRWDPSTGLETVLLNQTLPFSRLTLAPDEKSLLYTAYSLYNQQVLFDLFELNLLTGKHTRLTEKQRIMQGEYFADGYLVVKNDFGKTQLYQMSRSGELTRLTDFDYNFAINDLTMAPDQKRIALNFNYNGKRGVGIMSTETWDFEKIYFPDQGLDWLLGEFVDNEHITFSSDRLNHYDLYQLNITNDEMVRLTDTSEDIMQGQIYTSNGETLWYGQIYGPEGFTIARGEVASYETITLVPADISIAPAATVTPEITRSGEYNHLTQLRSDLIMPYFDTSAKRIGVSQLLVDPLMELQVIYDLAWNYDEKRPELALQTAWTGTNPGFNLTAEIYGTDFDAFLTEVYQLFPYSVAFGQSFGYNNTFRLDGLQAVMSRTWTGAYPGTTSLEFNYLPATATSQAGYGTFARHQMNVPVGYNGDSLNLTTTLGAAGGSYRIRWGVADYLWVYQEEQLAEAALIQQITYQRNLLDLSRDLNLVQTGRLYGSLSAEFGLFSNNDEIRLGNMLTGGLEMETMVLNLIPLNYKLEGAINSNANWDIRFGVVSPI